MTSQRIGVLGGTFDPMHCGHLAAAAAARDALALSHVLVVPSRVPPHRPVRPRASAYHRFAMAALAVSGQPAISVSDDELRADVPSYTADTLDRLRAAGTAPSRIFFIIGADAFADIAAWMRYPAVLDLANFVVVSRPGHTIDALAGRLPALAGRLRPASRVDSSDDRPWIYLLESSTPDVSSTAVRERLGRRMSVSGLVPQLVEAHIHKHGLYSTADQLHGED